MSTERLLALIALLDEQLKSARGFQASALRRQRDELQREVDDRVRQAAA